MTRNVSSDISQKPIPQQTIHADDRTYSFIDLLARVACRQAAGLCVLLILLLFLFKDDLNETSCLRIYQTDFNQIFRISRHIGGDDQYDIRFSIAQGTLLW